MRKTFNLLDINSVRPIVREVLRYKKSGFALDLGSSAGRHSLFLAKNGFRVTSVDNKTESLAALKELARLQKLPIVVCWEDVITYESKKKFDIILFTMVLHFLPKLVQKEMIMKIQELTKKDGINVVSSYTNKNKKGTRPHLLRAGTLKELYKNSNWKILDYKERLGTPMPSLSGESNRYWVEELIIQKL